jgi:hypothetical protein
MNIVKKLRAFLKWFLDLPPARKEDQAQKHRKEY